MIEGKPDRLLISIPSRYCPRCDDYRLFSLDATMCLACGNKRGDKFEPIPEEVSENETTHAQVGMEDVTEEKINEGI